MLERDEWNMSMVARRIGAPEYAGPVGAGAQAGEGDGNVSVVVRCPPGGAILSE
jgi:hypothetical protein